jgi:hypothetical protein
VSTTLKEGTMSDLAITDETQATGRGVARRDLIKKAAVAGGVAWAAPIVLASPAEAQVQACTPKCGPTVNGSFTGKVFLRKVPSGCEQQGPVNGWHPAYFTIGPITNSGSGCGCGTTPTLCFAGLDTFHVANDDWEHGYGQCLHVAYVGRHPDHPHLATATPIFATIKCQDRKGNWLCRTCEIYGTFCWTYTDEAADSENDCLNSPAAQSFDITYTIKACGENSCCQPGC